VSLHITHDCHALLIDSEIKPSSCGWYDAGLLYLVAKYRQSNI